jgi:general secretion pathway protein J
MIARRDETGGENGFTLLELLIALVLLGLVFAVLGAGLRFGTLAWQAGAAQLADADERQLVDRVIRRQLAAALAGPDGVGQSGEAFTGTVQELHFIGPAPARSMPAGVYHLELRLEPDGNGQALVLSWRNADDTSVPGAVGAEPVLRDLADLRFAYFGDRGDGTRDWSDHWQGGSGPPRAVRISVTFADPTRPPWPPLTVAVMAGNG